jgi:hypothetical protein
VVIWGLRLRLAETSQGRFVEKYVTPSRIMVPSFSVIIDFNLKGDALIARLQLVHYHTIMFTDKMYFFNRQGENFNLYHHYCLTKLCCFILMAFFFGFCSTVAPA